MESSKLYAFLFMSMLFISSFSPILACPYCGKGKPPPKKHKPTKKPPAVKPPVTVPPVKPPVTLPPVTLPPIKPPITLPPVTLPPVKPPVDLPPIKPPVELPPIKPPVELPPIKPPVELPPIKPPVDLPPLPTVPILNPPTPPNKGSPCGPAQATCPIDTLKLGACVDLLNGLVHVGLGDPAVNTCCPVLQGLVAVEAAVCLCTTLKLKLLNLNIYVPIALQLLVTCGKTPPPGFTCSL
ncbi:hypothetical protein K1719_011356 [Acacia pycnantha]|nr:hypothetical protein K1719_011356 [Acacia pycnantha]